MLVHSDSDFVLQLDIVFGVLIVSDSANVVNKDDSINDGDDDFKDSVNDVDEAVPGACDFDDYDDVDGADDWPDA